MTERDDILDRVIDTLKEPVGIDPRVDERVMAVVEQLPTPRRTTGWRSARWTIRLSPLGGLAAAAALAVLVVATYLFTRSQQPARVAQVVAHPTSQTVTQFVLVAPNADSVLLVGDFNDWGLKPTQLERQGGGVWYVTLALPAGRYRYAFLVNGKVWRTDPRTPASEDEFGRPNSVITIGGA